MTAQDDKQRARDDRLAIGAVLIGGTLAFIGRQDPMALGTGCALGLSGVILALRGERRIAARNWLRAALFISLIAFMLRYGLERYQEWIVAQWFAEGHAGTQTNYELQQIGEVAAGMRIGALATSLMMLVGAAFNRV